MGKLLYYSDNSIVEQSVSLLLAEKSFYVKEHYDDIIMLPFDKECGKLIVKNWNCLTMDELKILLKIFSMIDVDTSLKKKLANVMWHKSSEYENPNVDIESKFLKGS